MAKGIRDRDDRLVASLLGAGGGAPRPGGGAVPSWRAVLAAPLLAAALYLRYASCVPIAILGVAWLIFGWRGIVRRPAPILATAALFLLLLVPHAWEAIHLTGSPLGILLESGRVPSGHASPGDYPGAGLVAYLARNPFVFYGWLVPPLLIAGLVSPRPGAVRLFLWACALPAILAITLIAPAQVRYVAFGLTLLAILGVDAIRRALGRCPPRARRVIAGLAVVAVAASWLLVMRVQLRHGARRTAGTAATLAAAEAIRRDAAGRPCLFLGQHYTQLEWYSGCRSADEGATPPPGVPLYVVRDRGPGWQPALPDPARSTAILERPELVQVRRVDAGR